MKKIYIIALVSAMISGLLIYGFLSGYEKKDKTQKAAAKGDMENIVVAVVDIPAYTEITGEMVTLKAVPIGVAHTSAARKVEDVVGKVTGSDIIIDEHVLKSKLLDDEGSGTSLSLQIPEGMRAMTIATDVTSGVAGYIEEGDLIDIMANINASPNDEVNVSGENKTIKSSVTTTVVEAVQVLKLGNVTSAGNEDFLYESITLLLTPEQCQEIFVAEKLGSLKIVLREKTDDKKVEGKAIKATDIVE